MTASLASRRLVPEWLDLLPSDDPRAMRSRRDLVLVNALMGHAGVIARHVRGTGARRIADLGGGSGEMLARVARKARLAPPVEAVLVDMQPCVTHEVSARLSAAKWTLSVATADVFVWLESQADGAFDLLMANLFLHHLEPAPLARLLQLASRKARCFIACEPRRSALALAGARMLPLLGCNDVTRHDAVVSVEAGFRDGELSHGWPADWRVEERALGLFSHLLVARAP
jgi:hypothetical protein